MARAIAINGLALIVVSIFIGAHILAFFGISLPVVQVAGGLMVMSTAWRSFAVPMRTMPAPGSISVVIALGADHSPAAHWSWAGIVGLLIGAIGIAISIYLSYRFAERIA